MLAKVTRMLNREIVGIDKRTGERSMLTLAMQRLREMLNSPNEQLWPGAIDRLQKFLPYVAPTLIEQARLVQTQDALETGKPINFTMYLNDRGFSITPLISSVPDTAQEVTCTPVQPATSGVDLPGQDDRPASS